MNHRPILMGVGLALIVFGMVGTIIAIIPQIESLLLALAGRGYAYFAVGIVGGLLLTFSRRKPARRSPEPTL